MDDVTAGLSNLEAATGRFRDIDVARDAAREEVVALALDLLRAGVEPGDVYSRVPFTSTQMRSLARDAGIPPGKPGIKPAAGKSKTARTAAAMRVSKPVHGKS